MMYTDKTRTPQNMKDGTGRYNKLAYRDGYIDGRESEHHSQKEKRVIRDKKTAANGLLFGITVTALLGILGSAIFFAINQHQPAKTSMQIAPQPTISDS
ncbi:MAG TPA: hypothetical protein V6D35_00200 [Candidatus Sericytochromatia bacterium]|jgi:hypothetical protein